MATRVQNLRASPCDLRAAAKLATAAVAPESPWSRFEASDPLGLVPRMSTAALCATKISRATPRLFRMKFRIIGFSLRGGATAV